VKKNPEPTSLVYVAPTVFQSLAYMAITGGRGM
jgi:hypothetical protein